VTQLELLRHTVAALEKAGIPYAIVGSYASGIWGEARLTLDIDIVVQLRAAHVDALAAAFPAPEFYLSRPAAEEAIRHCRPFNVIHPTSGGKIDFMVVSDEGWPSAQLARRRRVALLTDLDGEVASPDDVILGKLVYFAEGGSEKHLRDIAGILKVSAELVDRDYLREWIARLSLSDAWSRVAGAS
jgi:hypothetical protein